MSLVPLEVQHLWDWMMGFLGLDLHGSQNASWWTFPSVCPVLSFYFLSRAQSPHLTWPSEVTIMMSPWLFDFAYRGCVLGRQGGLSVWHGVKRDVTADSTLNHIIFLQVKSQKGLRQTFSLCYSGILLFSTTSPQVIAGVFFKRLSQPQQRFDWLLNICRDIKERKDKWDVLQTRRSR